MSNLLTAPRLKAIALVLGLAALAGVARVMPHAPNFTPVAAVGLYVAFATRRASLGVLTALIAVVAADLAIGGYQWQVQAVVWAALAVPALFGARIPAFGGNAAKTMGIASGAAFAGALLFFIASNLATWAFTGMYANTAAGLMTAFAAAVPFFKYTLAGDLLWTAVFFGAHAALLRAARNPSSQIARLS